MRLTSLIVHIPVGNQLAHIGNILMMLVLFVKVYLTNNSNVMLHFNLQISMLLTGIVLIMMFDLLVELQEMRAKFKCVSTKHGALSVTTA